MGKKNKPKKLELKLDAGRRRTFVFRVSCRGFWHQQLLSWKERCRRRWLSAAQLFGVMVCGDTWNSSCMMLRPAAALPRLLLKALGMENSWHSGERGRFQTHTCVREKACWC